MNRREGLKIVTIVGASPQFIKAAAVSRAIKIFNRRRVNSRNKLREILIHTGQHDDYLMDKVFFEELKLLKGIIIWELGKVLTGSRQERCLNVLRQSWEK